jgi:hypothetical protein
MARDGTARSLDLARGNALGLDRLQAIGPEVEVIAALGGPVDATLMGLAVFRSLGESISLILAC